MVKLADTHENDMQEMRAIYCEALIREAERDDRIVAVNCDLRSSMGLKPFAKQFPHRELNVGIMEANACGMAAGMSAAGLVPFFNTFAVFASRRVYDQIFQSCAYAGLNVKIIGGDAGISATSNGGTHMPFEDLGIMRVMPGISVMEPTDGVMLRSLIAQMANTYGVQYLRFPRRAVPRVYAEGSEFTIGKSVLLRDGADAAVIAGGIMVIEALRAAEILAERGIQVRVVDMFTIKPIDQDAVIACARKTGAVVTAENHQVIGGLGSAVAEVLSEHAPVPLERVGVKDEFGEVGSQDYLAQRFGLTPEKIVDAVERVMKRKQRT